MKWINGFCLICIFLCASFFHKARASNDSCRHTVNAEALYLSGNFFEAAIAYERAFFYSDDDRQRMKANLGRAAALKQQGDYSGMIRDLQRSVHLRQFEDLHYNVLYEMALAYFLNGNHSNAMGFIQQIKHYYSDKYNSTEVIRLYALASVMSENFELAQDLTLRLIRKQVADPEVSDSLFNKTFEVFCACAVPVLRSQTTAARWSTFIPGTGHWYAGYPGKGALNAGMQLVSLASAAFMGYHGLYISGFVVGLGMFQSFYFGGINQAAYLVGQRNNINMGEYKDFLKSFIINLSLLAN